MRRPRRAVVAARIAVVKKEEKEKKVTREKNHAKYERAKVRKVELKAERAEALEKMRERERAHQIERKKRREEAKKENEEADRLLASGGLLIRRCTCQRPWRSGQAGQIPWDPRGYVGICSHCGLRCHRGCMGSDDLQEECSWCKSEAKEGKRVPPGSRGNDPGIGYVTWENAAALEPHRFLHLAVLKIQATPGHDTALIDALIVKHPTLCGQADYELACARLSIAPDSPSF